MSFIDFSTLNSLSPREFRNTRPYAWMNPQGFLTEQGFATLRDALPDISLFQSTFGQTRHHGQKNHDRFSLEYRPDLDIDPVWHAFMAELNGPEYTRWLKKCFSAWNLKLSAHWHYTPNGCSVSPHCDSRKKLGSHIFYFNTEQDWQEAWGGETIVLDDHGEFTDRSAPEFSDFYAETAATTLGNRSLLFKRTNHAWHGVKAVQCPEGAFRKVFIVVVERVKPIKILRKSLAARLQNFRQGDGPAVNTPASKA